MGGRRYRQSSRNPSDASDVIGESAEADPEKARRRDLRSEDAIRVVGEARPDPGRANLLDKVGLDIMARKDELGRLLSREEGKTLPEGNGEAMRAAHIFKFFAGEACGDAASSSRRCAPASTWKSRASRWASSAHHAVELPDRDPGMEDRAGARPGNTVVIKPATWCRAARGRRRDLRASRPAAGRAQRGRRAAARSSATSWSTIPMSRESASPERGDRVWDRQGDRADAEGAAEMGGKNPLVVLDDGDLPTAVNVAVEVCTRRPASVHGVMPHHRHADIHDRFVEAVADRVKTLNVGDALRQDTQMGPVASQSQLDQHLPYLDIGHPPRREARGGG